MRFYPSAVCAIALGFLMPGLPASGHHGSNVVYDLTQSMTVTGTVVEFRFVNPHALIFIDVTGEDGQVVKWLAGLPSASGLGANEGWTRDTLSPGDLITVTGSPARGGAASVWTAQIVRDGQALLKQSYTG